MTRPQEVSELTLCQATVNCSGFGGIPSITVSAVNGSADSQQNVCKTLESGDSDEDVFGVLSAAINQALGVEDVRMISCNLNTAMANRDNGETTKKLRRTHVTVQLQGMGTTTKKHASEGVDPIQAFIQAHVLCLNRIFEVKGIAKKVVLAES
jgi:hypothetical protein